MLKGAKRRPGRPLGAWKKSIEMVITPKKLNSQSFKTADQVRQELSDLDCKEADKAMTAIAEVAGLKASVVHTTKLLHMAKN